MLATGGFEYNEELKREYLAGYPIFAYGNSANTGDGIKLAQELGADLWHMRAVAAPMGYKVRGFDSCFSMRLLGDGYIIVDQNGERFCNEIGLEHYSMWMAVTAFDMASVRFSRIPSYVIFDESTRLKGPITRVGHGANRDYRWSEDNGEEIRKGWIVASDSAADLAGQLGIKNGARLDETVESYRRACAAGVDEQFGRAQRDACGLGRQALRHRALALFTQHPGRSEEKRARRDRRCAAATRSNGFTAPASSVPSGDFSIRAAAILANVWGSAAWSV